jgi:hypothetical protein
LLLFAGLVVATLRIASESEDTTTKLFLYKKAKALGRSATEISLLAISGHDKNLVKQGKCLKTLEIKGEKLFKIIAYFHYIGFEKCSNSINKNLKYKESNGTVIIDVIVTFLGEKQIRFHRRTVQKP